MPTEDQKTEAKTPSVHALSAGSEMWAFSSEPASEYWKGPYASKHEAISEALAHYGAPEDGFRPCVSRCRPVRPDDDHMWQEGDFVCEGEIEEIEIIDSQNDKAETRSP